MRPLPMNGGDVLPCRALLLGGALALYGCVGLQPSDPARTGNPPSLELRVEAFGAVGDGQTDDGPALRRAIAAAVASRRPAIVRFAPRVYRIGPRDDQWCSLDLRDAQDVTLEGEGTTLLFHPKNRAIQIRDSRAVTLRGFAIDYDPLPFTQGDILAVDRETNTFTVRIQEGYALPSLPDTYGWQGCFIDPGTRRYTHQWLYVGGTTPIPERPRELRIIPKDPNQALAVLPLVKPGQVFAFRLNHLTPDEEKARFVIGQTDQDRDVYYTNPCANIQIENSRDCVLEDIDQFSAPLMGVRLQNTDGILVRRFRIRCKPGTDRLVASLSDGIHAMNNRTGPCIEDCHFEGLFDDAIDISTHSEVVQERLSDREFRVSHADIVWFDSALRVGDRVLAWDPAAGRELGRHTVTSVRFLSSRARVIIIEPPCPEARDTRTGGYETATEFHPVAAGFTVRNCTFRSQLKTAMVLCSPGLCQGNVVSDTAYGIHGLNTPTSQMWRMGQYPHDLVIADNTFERVWIGAIVLLATSGRPDMRPAEPVGGNLRITGNRIREIEDGDGLALNNLRDVEIARNTIESAAPNPLRSHLLNLGNCRDVTIAHNRLSDPRPAVDAAVLCRSMAPETVTLLGNTWSLAAPAQRILFVPP